MTLHPRVAALFLVFGGEMAAAKIQTVKGKGWRFFAEQKILLGLDGLDSRNGDRTGLFSVGRCAILGLENQPTSQKCKEDTICFKSKKK